MGFRTLGWWKAAGKIPKMKRALDKIEKAGGESRPILTGAAKNVTRMAPFEGGRVLGAAALGGDVEDTAYSALAGLGIEGVPGRARWYDPGVWEETRSDCRGMYRG